MATLVTSSLFRTRQEGAAVPKDHCPDCGTKTLPCWTCIYTGARVGDTNNDIQERDARMRENTAVFIGLAVGFIIGTVCGLLAALWIVRMYGGHS